MKILVTGAAGFIGSSLILRLLERGDTVVGIDNHNSYYDPALKESRLARHADHPNYNHLRVDLSDRERVDQVFALHKPQIVVNLAAQAGIRYSIDNPLSYINSNLVGFGHILEGCRHHAVKHLVYASSSSVYGANTKMPFSEHHNVDHPLSLYAATKRANELMAHSYSHIYGLPTTGLRFFTVYGPWGRPDMVLFKFTKAILAGDKISVFNYGKHLRDFTYIDDIVECIVRAINRPAAKNLSWSSESPDPGTSRAPWRIYNVGNSNPINLMDYIVTLERALHRKAKIELLPPQLGEVLNTCADMTEFAKEFDYKPTTSIQDGIADFIRWYLKYYKISDEDLISANE